MRRYCLIAIGCLALLTACGARQAEMPAETVVSSEADAAGGDGSLENGAASDADGASGTNGTPNIGGSSGETAPSGEEKRQADGKLTQEEIDTLCGQLYSTTYPCGDGSQIILAGVGNDYIYIKYMPKPLGNGNYSFFREFHPSYEVTVNQDGTVDIPISINDSDSARFVLNADYSLQDGKLVIEKGRFTFRDKNDEEFDKMFSELYSTEQWNYRLSLTPDRSMPDEKLAEFLRACVYNGNFYVLDTLYDLAPKDGQEERDKLELAGAMAGVSKLTYSADNPYLPEIYYGESCAEFPQRDVLELVAAEVRTGAGLEEMGAERVEQNADWEKVYSLPGFKELYPYVSADEFVTGVYNYDLDGDGLPEYLILFPGGSMGNHFWEVLHLDGAGKITDTNSGEGMGYVSLYRYQGKYFFVNESYDYYDREWLGWQVHALNQSGQMYMAEAVREKTGSEIVFTDQYVDVEPYYYLDWYLERYIDQYKEYETEPMGREIVSDEETQKLFGNAGSMTGIYGVMDFNNDGVDDWTNVYKFLPSGRYPYYCSYALVDGKTKEVLDFSKLTDLFYNPRCVFPYTSEGKNYFLFVLNGYGNYVFKLVEFQGMEPVEIQSWLVTVENRVLVHAMESHGSRIGI